ncbi:NYN domain-containing protein [Cellulosimicrobium protaetiae]|uniref:NYN domain-containing protein n=1 Tax=Cellulosimicrobium protaetiae TaxID=2587808 RepID=A0A6M5UFA9_9MICO|nr:NYN domain-containing protein [Cellulosimicrobium protaetiae]QJW35309.1 NYN domain-containing protein [Cellulosimicrobium protaetiae]
MDTEERLAVFIDYENLALGAREHLGGMTFDFGPIADALAVRGRVVVRRAYADWSYFDEDRRSLTRHQVELIEMPQRMGASRKNAADIKMVVDAIEMAFERDYISTFVMCTGDSDFSPLVHKLRELNKRVIGVGVEKSTSRLLPPACDEFLFYDRLEGVDVPDEPEPRSMRGGRASGGAGASSGNGKPKRAGGRTSGRRKATEIAEPEAETPAAAALAELGEAVGRTTRRGEPVVTESDEVDETTTPVAEPREAAEAPAAVAPEADDDAPSGEDLPMEVRVAQTLADLEASTSGAVTASVLKRTLLRKDPTFSEADYGFRNFGEFLRFLADRSFVELAPGPATGDPEVSLPAQGDTDQAFALVREVVQEEGGSTVLSGLKNAIRKKRPDFSEKALGYRGFLQFCKAAQAAGAVDLAWDDDADDYRVSVA